MPARPDAEPTTEVKRESVGTMLSLVVIGSSGMASYPLPQAGRIVIGRSTEADVHIDDPSVSRQHAVLEIGERITIVDLQSSNGSTVRGQRIEPGQAVEVALNDVIEVGTIMVIVQRRAFGDRPRRIWSHGYFEVRIEEECARAQRSASEFAVLRVRLGAGDAAVLEDSLVRHVRPGDVVASYGPRDYEVLLVETTAAETAAIVDRVRGDAEQAGLSLTTGVACYPRDGHAAEQLVDTACAGVASSPRTRSAASPLVRDASGVMERLHKLAARVAQGTINVLLLGETGAGKEVMAEQIHALSPRARRPLVRLSCASFTEQLLESELFGHERGAFTGADRSKPGLVESAEGGTLFLDEIGELPLSLQPKLLRVLEDRKVMRLGSLQQRTVDVRFIAATNRDLDAEVRRERFRADLYFRLSGVTLVIPPLRERVDEIPVLVRMFLDRAASELGRVGRVDITPAALELLLHYPWPGNVRELRNVIERAVLLSGDESIGPDHLPLDKMRATRMLADRPAGANLHQQVHDLERARILEALEQCSGNQTRAAKLLGISRMTLSTRMNEYGVPRPRKDKRRG